MLKVKKIISGPLEVNCYIVYDDQTLKSAIIDPGEDGAKIIKEVKAAGFSPEMLINTHGHYDHMLSDNEIKKEFAVPLAVYKDEAEMVANPNINASALFSAAQSAKADILFLDGQEVKLSFTVFKVIHTPGHTAGGMSLLFDGFVITGDTLFAGTIGRTDFPGSSYEDMTRSLEKLKKLPPSTVVYPGHGSQTTIANELRHNPYLKND
ncbi:MBL fold metallo-hydrolase [Endomicrobium proavitum]|uniref:Putative Zn-dependent hydrolase n=1 Tax=Endomicrobium proavitum TaxID=1408281 RepID=A0A0G3WH56_9BACT|nr:MBL fold metallo-hydrolase [Endomicrobium proavitum]AKL97951.1 putative Zn-dependent hydrolase [Endomicrobium proavitum]